MAAGAYVDASCVVAIALTEPGWPSVRKRLARAGQLYAANLLEAEVGAAFRREGLPPNAAPLSGIAWIIPDRALSAELDRVFEAGRLRGADAWHLAAALYFAPEPSAFPFLTLDERQAEVAAALGFPA